MMRKLGEALLMMAVVSATLLIGYAMLNAMWKQHEFEQRQQAREAQWLNERKARENCQHTGYYGKYGRHRVYNCNGKVLVEYGNQLVNKEAADGS